MSESGFKLKGTGAYDRDIANARSASEIDEINRRYLGRSFGSDVEFDESTQRYRNTKTGQLVSADDLNAEARGTPTIQGGEKMFSQDITLSDGRTVTVSAESQEQLAYDVRLAVSMAEAIQETNQEPTAAERAAAQAELEQQQAAEVVRLETLKLRMQRGEIGIDEYITQSGAVDRYLEQQGISLDSLRNIAQGQEDNQTQQSWNAAVEEFLQGPGANWPGGEENREILTMALEQLGLTDSDDKVSALKQAYDFVLQKGVLHAYRGPEEDAAELTKNMSPAEILAAWHEQQLKSGKTVDQLNDEFVRKNSSTGSGLFGR